MKAGWKVKSFDEVAEVKGGKRLPKGYKLQSEKTEFPYITVSDFTDDGTVDFSKVRFITQEVFEQIKRYTISTKDIYISIAGTIGKTGRVPYELDGASLTENACKLVLKPNIARDFIYYFTESQDFFTQAGLNTRTTAQPKLALERLKTIKLAIPESLNEQQRIVAMLDQAFEGIAKARTNAQQNLQNARTLFESHLQSLFTQHGEGWAATKLGAEIDLLVGFAFKSAHYTTSPDDVRLLRGDNIIQGRLRWDDVKMWPSHDSAIYSQYSLREGDVVLAMDRPWVKAGLKHATISADDLPCLLVQRTACLRAGLNLHNRFLVCILGSVAFTNHILGVQTGSGVPHISGQQIKDFQFSRPPINEQKHISQSLDSLQSQIQRLEALYQCKIALLDELKKSLLQQAFAGEL